MSRRRKRRKEVEITRGIKKNKIPNEGRIKKKTEGLNTED
jgi:hypothetical protein